MSTHQHSTKYYANSFKADYSNFYAKKDHSTKIVSRNKSSLSRQLEKHITTSFPFYQKHSFAHTIIFVRRGYTEPGVSLFCVADIEFKWLQECILTFIQTWGGDSIPKLTIEKFEHTLYWDWSVGMECTNQVTVYGEAQWNKFEGYQVWGGVWEEEVTTTLYFVNMIQEKQEPESADTTLKLKAAAYSTKICVSSTYPFWTSNYQTT